MNGVTGLDYMKLPHLDLPDVVTDWITAVAGACVTRATLLSLGPETAILAWCLRSCRES